MSSQVTTIDRSTPRSLGAELSRLRRKVFSWIAVDGLNRLLACLLLLLAADLLIDWYFLMDRAQRAVMLFLGAGALAAVGYRYLVRPLMARLNDQTLCYQVEGRHASLAESLLSAVEFSRIDRQSQENVSERMIEATIDQGVRRARQVSFGDVLRKGRFAANVGLLAVLTAAVFGIVVAVQATETMNIWYHRNVLLEDKLWPLGFGLQFDGIAEDGNLVMIRGEDWPVCVRVREDSERAPDKVLLEMDTDAGRRVQKMKPTEGKAFEAQLAVVSQQMRLRAVSGRVATDWVPVRLVERPEVDQLQLIATSPAYAGGVEQLLPSGGGPYDVLKGSRLSIQGSATKSLSSATLVAGSKRWPLKIDNQSQFQLELPPAEVQLATYVIELLDNERIIQPGADDSGPIGSRRPAQFSMRIQPDHVPQVKVTLRGISTMVTPRARIPYTCRVEDDFAVSAAQLNYRWRTDSSGLEGTTGTSVPDEAAPQLGKKNVAFQSTWDLETLKIPVGAGLSFHVEAQDNDDVSGPKTGKSPTLLVRVVNETELRADLLRREMEYRQTFEQLLAQQDVLMTNCEALLAASRGAGTLTAEQRAVLARAHKRQQLQATNMARLAERLTEILVEIDNNRIEDNNSALRERLRHRVIAPMDALASDDISLAARLIDQARRAPGQPKQRDQALEDSVARQQDILHAMRQILIAMVKNEGFQKVVNLLYEIKKNQENVLVLTDNEKEQRIRELLKQPKNGETNDQPQP